MKGLKINSRVEGIAVKNKGWDGRIVEIILLDKKKQYKVQWENGQVLVHFPHAIKIWGAAEVRRGPYLARRAAAADPVVNNVAENRLPDDGERRVHEDDDSDSSTNYGSRYFPISAIKTRAGWV
jgi:hypothetical protein